MGEISSLFSASFPARKNTGTRTGTRFQYISGKRKLRIARFCDVGFTCIQCTNVTGHLALRRDWVWINLQLPNGDSIVGLPSYMLSAL